MERPIMRAPLRFLPIICLATVGIIARADSAEPGKPWQRPGSTVLKVVLCDNVDSAGQPRHAGQKFTVAQRAVVLVVDANPKGDRLTYDVLWSREGKTVLQKSWQMDCPLRRIFTFSSHTAAHLPIGSYQVEVRESGLAVWRIPFVITAVE